MIDFLLLPLSSLQGRRDESDDDDELHIHIFFFLPNLFFDIMPKN